MCVVLLVAMLNDSHLDSNKNMFCELNHLWKKLECKSNKTFVVQVWCDLKNGLAI